MADRPVNEAAPATPSSIDDAGAAPVLAPAKTGGRTGTAGAVRGAGKRRRYSVLSGWDKLSLALMVGIPLAFFLVMIWGSTLASFYFSFNNWNGITQMTWVGTRNYEQLINGTYPFFWPAVQHNLIWLAFLMFIATPMGIFLAYLLNGELRATRFYQTVFYLPVVLSLAVIGIIWQLQYASGAGFIDQVLNRPDIDWYGDSSLNLWAALIAASWRHVGYITILYLAGLKSFDPSLQEAAAIDGANARQTFFRVVFPVMRPINTVIVVITTIEAFRAFDLAYIINGGRNGLELLSTDIVNTALSESTRVGFGSAIAIVLLLISLVPICTFLIRQFRGETA